MLCGFDTKIDRLIAHYRKSRGRRSTYEKLAYGKCDTPNLWRNIDFSINGTGAT